MLAVPPFRGEKRLLGATRLVDRLDQRCPFLSRESPPSDLDVDDAAVGVVELRALVAGSIRDAQERVMRVFLSLDHLGDLAPFQGHVQRVEVLRMDTLLAGWNKKAVTDTGSTNAVFFSLPHVT